MARLWRRYWLEPLLTIDSSIPIQPFPPSRYLALPLSSIMKIARYVRVWHFPLYQFRLCPLYRSRWKWNPLFLAKGPSFLVVIHNVFDVMSFYSLHITYSWNHLPYGRDCGWRSVDPAPVDADPCSVCLERRCTVAAEGNIFPFW